MNDRRQFLTAAAALAVGAVMSEGTADASSVADGTMLLSSGQTGPEVFYDAQTGGPNLSIGGSFPNIQEPTAFSNIALGGGWRADVPTTGNLGSVTTGRSNTAIGAGVLVSLTSGWADTAIGADSLSALTTGYGNTAVGAQCLESITSASKCTAVGQAALQEAIGGPNTAVGFRALTTCTTGADNVAIGNEAASAMTTGEGNVALGAYVGVNSITTGSLNTFIGHRAGNNDGRTHTSNVSSATLIGEHAQSQISNVIVLGKGVGVRPNLYFGIAPRTDLCGGGSGCFFIANAAREPSGDPSAGGILYVSRGRLMYCGPGGTRTTIAYA